MAFSVVRFLTLRKEIKDKVITKQINELRREIYTRSVKECRARGIKGKLDWSREDTIPVMNEVGEAYIRETMPDCRLKECLLEGKTWGGEKEEKMAVGDLSFTHDDSAKNVFGNMARVNLTSVWDVTNVFRYMKVAQHMLNTRIPDVKEQVTVDVGCSSGTFLRFWNNNMAQPGKQRLIYTGIEVVAESVEEAREKFKQEYYTFICADIIKQGLTELHNKPTDAVMLLEVIEHVGRENGIKLVEDAHKILKTGGHVYISSPNPDKANGQEFVWADNHAYEFTRAEITEILEKTGFEIVSVSGWYYDSWDQKRKMTPEQRALHTQLRELNGTFAGCIMAHLYPELGLHYTIIAKKV